MSIVKKVNQELPYVRTPVENMWLIFVFVEKARKFNWDFKILTLREKLQLENGFKRLLQKIKNHDVPREENLSASNISNLNFDTVFAPL